ncbi:MAG: thioesterase family protein [Rhodovibrionaceae bacterium]
MENAPRDSAPLEIRRSRVLPEWIDYNGHLNVAYYVLAFDEAFDDFMDYVGIDAAHRAASGHSIFALELHVSYFNEVLEGAPLRFTFQLLDHDAKRLHYLLRMYHGETELHLASCEGVCVYVDAGARRSVPMPREVIARVGAVAGAQAGLDWPEEVGHVIGLPRRRPDRKRDPDLLSAAAPEK